MHRPSLLVGYVPLGFACLRPPLMLNVSPTGCFRAAQPRNVKSA